MKNLLFLFAALAFAGCASSGIDWSKAQPIADGIKLTELDMTEPRLMKAFVMRVDLKTKGLKFTGTPRSDLWGEPMPDLTNRICKIHTRRQTTVNFVKQQRAPVEEGGKGRDLIAAINTEPWDPWESPFNHKYANVYSPMISDGITVSERSTGGGAVFVVWKDGSADITKNISAEASSNIWVAATGFNRIMTNGVSMAKATDKNLAPRTAFGLSANKRYLYLLAVDGRQEGYSLGANMGDLVSIMKFAGAAHAMNMDGGGSTSMVYWDGTKPVMVNKHDNKGSMRSVGGNIGIYMEH